MNPHRECSFAILSRLRSCSLCSTPSPLSPSPLYVLTMSPETHSVFLFLDLKYWPVKRPSFKTSFPVFFSIASTTSFKAPKSEWWRFQCPRWRSRENLRRLAKPPRCQPRDTGHRPKSLSPLSWWRPARELWKCDCSCFSDLSRKMAAQKMCRTYNIRPGLHVFLPIQKEWVREGCCLLLWFSHVLDWVFVYYDLCIYWG